MIELQCCPLSHHALILQHRVGMTGAFAKDVYDYSLGSPGRQDLTHPAASVDLAVNMMCEHWRGSKPPQT